MIWECYKKLTTLIGQLRLWWSTNRMEKCDSAEILKQLNRRINVDQHPIPTLDVFWEKLQGGQFYSKIDLADAYLQLELDEDAKKLCVISTPFELCQYHRMCFGVASSPAQFQKLMDTMIL